MLKAAIRISRNFRLKRSNFYSIATILMNNFGDSALDFLKKYPPQRNPDTNYVRGFGVRPNQRVSEDLGARWNKKLFKKNTSIILDVGNNASYAPFVQSLVSQADIHRDWWRTEEDMINELYPDLLNDFNRFLPNSIVGNK